MIFNLKYIPLQWPGHIWNHTQCEFYLEPLPESQNPGYISEKLANWSGKMDKLAGIYLIIIIILKSGICFLSVCPHIWGANHYHTYQIYHISCDNSFSIYRKNMIVPEMEKMVLSFLEIQKKTVILQDFVKQHHEWTSISSSLFEEIRMFYYRSTFYNEKIYFQ